MRLNLQTDYALRLLMHVAVNEEKLSTISEIATRFNISKNHLMKVAHVLGQAKFIETIRGRGGGLRLARAADKIVIGDVVRVTEADLTLVECFQGEGGMCLITPACRLKGILSEALNAFLSVLDQYTIYQLVHRNKNLHNLLMTKAA